MKGRLFLWKKKFFFRWLFWIFFLSLSPLKGPGGEIGRHATLRGWWALACASSSLVLGTNEENRNGLIVCCDFLFFVYSCACRRKVVNGSSICLSQLFVIVGSPNPF